jgi:hypothetical protein
MSSLISDITEYNCLYCSARIKMMPVTHMEWATGILGGICSDSTCNNNNRQFVCKICFDYGSANQAPGRYSGGRRSGIFSSTKALKKHFKSLTHITAVGEVLDVNDNEILTGDDMDTSVNDSGNVNTKIQPSLDDIRKSPFHPSSNSPKFFVNEQKYPGTGAQYLTANAFSLSVDDVTFDEVNYSFTMASLLCQLTASQQQLLAEVMLHTLNAKDPKLSIFKKTRAPTSISDFNDLYTTGKHSIIQNLPHPVPINTDDGSHAYVSIMDILANELAFGTFFDKFRFDAGIQLEDLDNELTINVSNTPAAYRLFFELQNVEKNWDDNQTEEELFTLYLWFKEWRDDFDPNNTKASRNQVWINTYTVCAPDFEKKGHNTYFMAISGKGEDHSVVEKIFADELDMLSTTGKLFYHGGMKTMIRVKLGKLLTCVDRPERTTIFQCGDHNGTYSTNWGFAGSVDGLSNVNNLPSCHECRKKRILLFSALSHDMVINNYDCIKCSNWDVMDKKFTFPAPTTFPRRFDVSEEAPKPPCERPIVPNVIVAADANESNVFDIKSGNIGGLKNKRQRVKKSEIIPQKLITVKLSVSFLKEAVLFAHHNAKTVPYGFKGKSRYWNKGNVIAYLRTCGLTSRLCEQIYESAKNGEDLPTFPQAWRDEHAFTKCHYAGMHMLFLGNTKSNFEMTSTWLTAYDIKASFGKQVNKYLDIVRKLRITKFFTGHPLSTTKWGTGIWVSENYVFWAKTQNFWFLLPSVTTNKHSEKSRFILELKAIH